MSNSKNHRRANRQKVALRYNRYHNGYSLPAMCSRDEERPSLHDVQHTDPDASYQRVGKTRYLDKSLHGWGNKSTFADKSIGAGIGNDFCNGHRGMAKAVKGAKKYVRTRTRFHENAETKRLMKQEMGE